MPLIDLLNSKNSLEQEDNRCVQLELKFKD